MIGKVVAVEGAGFHAPAELYDFRSSIGGSVVMVLGKADGFTRCADLLAAEVSGGIVAHVGEVRSRRSSAISGPAFDLAGDIACCVVVPGGGAALVVAT